MLISLIYLSFFGFTGAGLYSFIEPKAISLSNELLLDIEGDEND